MNPSAYDLSSELSVRLVSVLTVLISMALIGAYRTRKISMLEAILYSIALQAYNIPQLGPTINATFFVSYYCLVEELLRFVLGRVRIRKSFLLLLVLPLFSSIIILIVLAENDIFYYPHHNRYALFLKPFYFYLKNYLPFFAVGAKVFREAPQPSTLFGVIKKIALWSCFVGILQWVLGTYTDLTIVKELLGMKLRYMSGFGLRISALFAESKNFGAFLGLALPLFVYERAYTRALVVLLMGLLTLSQTFQIFVLVAVIIFVAFKHVPHLRLQVIGTIAIISTFFAAINLWREPVVQFVIQHNDNRLVQSLIGRAAIKYNIGDADSQTSALGLPLQPDLELPVYRFFQDNPWLFVTGYGPGNSTFIPPDYFWGQYNYEAHIEGSPNHMNMRWFFYIAEWGIVIFLVFFLKLTSLPYFKHFVHRYYSFLWVCFFFNEIDLLLMMYFLILLRYRSVSDTFHNSLIVHHESRH
jgi:hypothetical protein